MLLSIHQQFSSDDIFKLKGKIDQILLAIPSLDKSASVKLLKKVQSFEIPILKVPSVEEITSGNAKIDSLRPIEIEDLLGRDPVPSFNEFLLPGLSNSSICVTGGGGSIGSELCEQIIRLKPNKIILFEQSEINLYKLLEKLDEIKKGQPVVFVSAHFSNFELMAMQIE